MGPTDLDPSIAMETMLLTVASTMLASSLVVIGKKIRAGHDLRAALHVEASPIPLEADCMKF